jgi:predicted RNase H-like HicB family nuclease
MLTEYIQAAMKRAIFEIIENADPFYGEIPGVQGVWANHATLAGCQEELREVLEEGIVWRLANRLELPPIDGAEVPMPREHSEAARYLRGGLSNAGIWFASDRKWAFMARSGMANIRV